MARVRKTVLAEQDLEDIWLHVATDNIGAADALIDSIVEKCALLATNTGWGALGRKSSTSFAAFRSGITFCSIDRGPKASN